MLTRKETVQLAASYAMQGFLCSESVLLALSRCLNVTNDQIPRIATGFGAGIGRAGEVCGALSGGVMGLGLRFGRSTVEEEQGERRPYWFARELVTRFRERFGCLRCRDLIGLDLSREEDAITYQEQKVWERRCREYIMTATSLAYDLLQRSSRDASSPMG